ncbi:AP2-like ethylene-responsive transcription factor [Glycine max]|nr:AP2-like ethylene-responsive transcription factor [Glycine max]
METHPHYISKAFSLTNVRVRLGLVWFTSMASSSSDPGKSEADGSSETLSEATAAAKDGQLRMKKAKKERVCTAKERISKMPPCAVGKRSSIYRGVTRHRWTGRYEAHLWDKSTWNQNQNKKGKQGAYDDEEAAARAYDLAALRYWGPRRAVVFQEDFPNTGDSPGEDSAAETKYLSSFCIERKIDLTSYIKWWGSNKSQQPDSRVRFSDVRKHGFAGDFCIEHKTLEQNVHPSEPYQLLALGMPCERIKHEHSSVSALSIVLQSAAYKNLQQRASTRQENSNYNDENENKDTIINKLDHGKAAEKSLNNDGGNERLDIAMGMSGSLPLQRNVYPPASLLIAPLLTAYNTVDPSVDPVLWTPQVPILSAGLSGVAEVAKTETSSTYTIFQPDE